MTNYSIKTAVFSTPNEIAKIRRMCEKGKFEGVYVPFKSLLFVYSVAYRNYNGEREKKREKEKNLLNEEVSRSCFT